MSTPLTNWFLLGWQSVPISSRHLVWPWLDIRQINIITGVFAHTALQSFADSLHLGPHLYPVHDLVRRALLE